MTHLKKSLAIFLAIVMIFSTMSVAASAAEFDPTVDGGFALDFTVKFFREDADGNWIETTRAKPGEKIKARVYVGTDFYTYSGSFALLFDSRFLDNPDFEDGVRTYLETNSNYMDGAVRFNCENAAWFEDETRYNQNLENKLVTKGVIDADYFVNFDIISNILEFRSGKTAMLSSDEWAVEYPLQVVDGDYTKVVNQEGTARVPAELAATTTSPYPMFINMPKGESGGKPSDAEGMYSWDAKISSAEGTITTTSNIVLNANGGYYLVDGNYEVEQLLPGIIGEKVKGLGSISPSNGGYILSGWSEVAIPADWTITEDVKAALGMSDSEAADQGNKLTDAQVEELALSPTEIAQYTYDYDDKTLYAVWTASAATDNYYTYQVYYMDETGAYPSAPDFTQQIKADTGAVVELPKTPVEGFALDTVKSNESIMVKGDKSSVLNAYYARNKYTVTYNYVDNSGIDQTQVHEGVYYGAAIPAFDAAEFPNGVPEKPGYTFSKWVTADGKDIPATMAMADIQAYPEYTKNTYTYVFDAGQDGKFESTGTRSYSVNYAYGDVPAAPAEAPVMPGKEFTGWDPEIPATVTSDMTFVADYSDLEYTVKFADGEKELASIPFYYGAKVYEEDIPDGYKAENAWYTVNADGGKTIVAFPYTVKGNATLYATDDADVYDAEFYVDGVLYDAIPTIYGEDIAVPANAPIKEGHIFKMWDPEVGVMDEKGKRYDAVFAKKVTTISFADTGDSTIEDITGEFDSAITATVSDPVKKGYTFKGWSVAIPEKMPADDMIISARWEKNNYTLTFNNYDGSLIGQITAPYESTVTAPSIPTEPGYTYAWDSEVPATMPAENKTFTAVRTPVEYSVTLNTNGGTPAEIPVIKADCGDDIQKPADPIKDGYVFGGWAYASNPDVAVPFPEKMPAGGLDLVAIWTKAKHNAYFSANGGAFADGKTMAVVADVEYGADITAPAAPARPGFSFDGWSPEVGKMANEDMYFDAKWAPIPSGEVDYKINVVTINPVDGSEITTTVIADKALPGETIEVVKKGDASNATKTYYFEDLVVSVSNVPVTTENLKMTIAETGENVLTVKCELKKVTVTFSANGGAFADGSDIAKTTENYGTELETPVAPTREGYTFNNYDREVSDTFVNDETYFAQWTKKSYNAIFTINGEEYATVPYEYGATIVAPAYTVADGYTFSGWNVPSGATMPAGNITFDAKLTQNEYTLMYTFSSAPIGATKPADVTNIKYGEDVTVGNAGVVDGYTFDGWTLNGAPVSGTVKVTENTVLVGSYTAITYDIAYDTGDSAIAAPATAVTSAKTGETIQIPTEILTKDGYKFVGWTYGGALYYPGADFTMPAGEVEFIAEWEKLPEEVKSYDVSYDWGADAPAGVTLPATAPHAEGSTVTVAAVPSADGYTFDGWRYNGKLTESFVMPGNAVVITGSWTKNEVPPTEYTLTLDGNGGAFADGETTFSIDLVEGATVVTSGNPIRDGYKFMGWLNENGVADAIPVKMPNYDVTLKADWAEIFDIKYVVDGSDYDTATGIADENLPTPSKGEPKKDGHTFAGWIDANGAPVTKITGDQTVYASWTKVAPNEHTIKYYSDTTLLKSETLAEGDAISDFVPDANFKPGYTFDGWTPEVPDNMGTEDIVVHAKWIANKHDISIDTNGGAFADGKTVYTDTDVEFGTKIVIFGEIPTREGYTFGGWKDENGAAASIPETMPDEDVNLTAVWNINKATVTFDAGDGKFADGTSSATSTGDFGSDIEVPANPARDGFTFEGWNGLDALNGKIPAKDVTITAIWKAEETTETYKLVVDAAGGKVNGQAKIEKELAEGEAISIADPVRDGYTFTGWVDANGDKADIPASMPAGDLTFTATWEANAVPTHTVTYYLADGADVYTTKTFEEGEVMDHPEVPADKYFTYKGWADKDGNALPEKIGDKDLVAYAVIDKPVEYKVTYLVDGAEYDSMNAGYGTAVPKPADEPTKAGYIFAGWTPNAPATMPAENLTFTAKWEEIPAVGDKFVAKFVADGVTHDFYVLEAGATIPTPETPKKFGYKFVGWAPEVPATMPAEDMEFVAQWEVDKDFVGVVIGGAVVAGTAIGVAIGVNTALITGAAIIGGILVIVGVSELVKHTHTVTYMVDGEVYKTYKVVEGTKIPVPSDPAKDGYKFAGWNPEVPEKMGETDLVFEAEWASETDVEIPDTGSAAGVAAFAAIASAAAAAFVLTNRKKKDEE